MPVYAGFQRFDGCDRLMPMLGSSVEIPVPGIIGIGEGCVWRSIEDMKIPDAIFLSCRKCTPLKTMVGVVTCR